MQEAWEVRKLTDRLIEGAETPSQRHIRKEYNLINDLINLAVDEKKYNTVHNSSLDAQDKDILIGILRGKGYRVECSGIRISIDWSND